MRFQTRETTRSVAGRHDVLAILEDRDVSARVEVWPALGFNCYHWEAALGKDRIANLLYVTDDFLTDPVPTRSGIPILFPFPNRIRDGRFPKRPTTIGLTFSRRWETAAPPQMPGLR